MSINVPLGHISPFFIVADLQRALAFYEQKLGFRVRFRAPSDSPFFGILGRDTVQIYLKEISQSVAPRPNHTQHDWAPWDAFVFVATPDLLAREFASRGVEFKKSIADTDDGLRGFEVADSDGYVLFFGRPK